MRGLSLYTVDRMNYNSRARNLKEKKLQLKYMFKESVVHYILKQYFSALYATTFNTHLNLHVLCRGGLSHKSMIIKFISLK